MKKQLYIIGNWKMKITSAKEAKKIFLAEKKIAGKVSHVQTIICAPFVYLPLLGTEMSGHRMALGAQNVFYEDSGAFTGEVSPLMLKENKVQYCLVGHSERRVMGETDDMVSQKIATCLRHLITPIVCVGELKRDNKGIFYKKLKDQLLASLKDIPREALGKIIFAYEPVWAISSTKNQRNATPEDAREMAVFMRKVLADHYGLKRTSHIRVIYGGSANKDNARDFLETGEIDGLLPGSASVDPKNFGEMIRIAGEVVKGK